MIQLSEFFKEEFFQSLKISNLKDHNQSRRLLTLKDAETGLTFEDILKNSNYGDLFSQSYFSKSKIKIITRSYRLNHGEIEKQLWHFDHSRFTLIIPINLSEKTSTKFSPFIRFGGKKHLLDNVLARLFAFRAASIPLNENEGLLFEGNRYYHTSALLQGPLTREILVLHFA